MVIFNSYVSSPEGSSRVFQDLSGDGGVLKRCLRTGTGSTLPEGGARAQPGPGGKKTALILVKPSISWGFFWNFMGIFMGI